MEENKEAVDVFVSDKVNETKPEANPKMVKKTMFPFDMIPTTVEVTDEHVLIIYQQLLGTKQEQLIPTQEIHNVSVESDLISETLVIQHGAPMQDLRLARFSKGQATLLSKRIKLSIDSAKTSEK